MASVMAVLAVIFDFGRVLTLFDKWRACAILAQHSPYSAEEIYSLLVGSELEKQLESGTINGTVFAREVLYRLRSTACVPDVLRAWGNIFTKNETIEKHIDRLMEKNVRLGVLSNTNEVHWPFACDLPVIAQLKRYGATFVLSHEVRIMKPDPAIYRTMCEKLAVAPEQALFLDDIEENVTAAREFGMRAEEYDCTKHSGARLEQIFKKHGVL